MILYNNILLPIAISIVLLVLNQITLVSSHGFISSPRSRNLVAFEDKVYYPLTADRPNPEDCPHCLNRGGTLARCGIINERNYDTPLNALNEPMDTNIQSIYSVGQIIDIEIQLTAHHRGHFVFSGCPILNTTTIPTQECFDQYPLQFISDELYGGNPDINYPERVYVAPFDIQNKVYSTKDNFSDAMVFQYKLKLPNDLIGESVLLQWYYVASNQACIHKGYDVYDWPSEWLATNGTTVKSLTDIGKIPCDEVLPSDGNGIPEQFWNCAEVRIVRSLSEVQSEVGEANVVEISSITDAIPVQQEEEVEVDPTQQQVQVEATELVVRERTHSKTIIGYYASWQWYDRNKLAAPHNMDFTKVTRVNFAFFQTDTSGNLWGTDNWADPNLLFGPYDWNPSENSTKHCSWDTPTTKDCKAHSYEEGLIYQVHSAGTEIYPSLGGWSLSDPFPAMAANTQTRTAFVQNCIELIIDYDFDGIDIDWEYPGYEDHLGTPEDTESYNLLLRDLRLELDELGEANGRFYGLTSALPCGTKHIANIDIPTVSKYLTELNLMSYDLFGSWSTVTGANAPLYDQEWGNEEVKDFSVDGCVRNWIKGGAPPSTINIGLPFYGRSFKGAKRLNETHDGNDKNTWFWDDGTPQYFNIEQQLSEFVSVRHEPTKTQYAYKNSSLGGLVSYDDEQAICDKTEYCLDHELNGFIIWELSGDMRIDLSTPLLDTLNDKLTEPSLDCKTLEYDPSKLPSFGALTTSSQVISQQVTVPAISPNSPAPLMTLDCSDGITGPRQHNGCTGYYSCVYGKAVYPYISCPEGTLFDEKSMLCLPSEQVTCSETSSPTNAPSGRSVLPNQVLSSSLSISPSDGISSSTSSSPTIIRQDKTAPPTWIQDTTTNTRPKQSSNPTVQQPWHSPSNSLDSNNDPSQAPMVIAMPNPNQTFSSQTSSSPIVESVISQAANDTEDEDPHAPSSTPLHQPDYETNPSNISNSPPAMVVSGDTSNDYTSSNSSQNSTPTATGYDPGTIVSWSVSTTYSTSSAESTPNSLLSQDSSSENYPFITIVISFKNSSPADIGWQLLSLDEVVNINQPIGAYKGTTLNTIVYESIVLKQTRSKRSASISEYSWIILSAKGKFDGQYKIYAGSPNGEALVVGSDFNYMDTVGLAATDDGVFLLSDVAVEEEPATDDKDVSVESLADPAQKVNDSVTTAEAEDDQQEEESNITSIMIPILISLVLLAVFGGVGLIIFAFRKKKEDMNVLDLTGDFDDNLDVEARTKQVETTSFYDSCHSSIDLPGSVFNSYESKPNADINTDIDAEHPPPDNKQQQQTAVNDLLLDLRAAMTQAQVNGSTTDTTNAKATQSVNRLLDKAGIMSSNTVDESYRQNHARASALRTSAGIESICSTP